MAGKTQYNQKLCFALVFYLFQYVIKTISLTSYITDHIIRTLPSEISYKQNMI